MRAKFEHVPIEKIIDIDENELPKAGQERNQMVKVRINQSFFRDTIMAAYNSTCCITGLTNREILIAGHIKPWSVDKKNRLNPRNGLALNALHDKAFETGLITITPEYKIKISSLLIRTKKNKPIHDYFLKYDK